jgi:hypothetical protein
MDAALHDVIAMQDVFFKGRLVIGVLEMTGDHDRLRCVRISGSQAPVTTTPAAGKENHDEAHDDSGGDEHHSDPGATIGEVSCQLLMKEGQLLLAEPQTIPEVFFIVRLVDQGAEQVHLSAVLLS